MKKALIALSLLTTLATAETTTCTDIVKIYQHKVKFASDMKFTFTDTNMTISWKKGTKVTYSLKQHDTGVNADGDFYVTYLDQNGARLRKYKSSKTKYYYMMGGTKMMIRGCKKTK